VPSDRGAALDSTGASGHSTTDTMPQPIHPVLLLVLALVGACATPDVPERLELPTPAPLDLEAREFRLGPNDIVRVGVHGHPELSTPASERFDGTRVDPDGTLSLPLVGALDVRGLTLAEARERVTAAFATYMKEPRVDLSVIEFSARRFYLYGEVEAPGPYAMDRPLNVYQALSFGGGFKTTAARRQVVLLREGRDEVEVHVIDGERIAQAGLMEVRPDDFLFVMRSGSGRFRDEALPILTGISATLASVGSLILIEDRVSD
jgi:protein involved in polysaccharide export with SLBB domain